MKITLFTNKMVQFRGINESLKKIQQQILNGNVQDTFTKSDSGENTIIIENYYENGNSKSKPGNMASEGAITGVTTGGAIEGTKSLVGKVKNETGKVPQQVDDLDLIEDKEVEPGTDINIETEHPISANIDIETTDNDIENILGEMKENGAITEEAHEHIVEMLHSNELTDEVHTQILDILNDDTISPDDTVENILDILNDFDITDWM